MWFTLCVLCRGVPWWFERLRSDEREPHDDSVGAHDVPSVAVVAWSADPNPNAVHGTGGRGRLSIQSAGFFRRRGAG